MFASQFPTTSRIVKRPATLLGLTVVAMFTAGTVSGCAHLGKEAIPSSAAVRAEGEGKTVAYTPDTHGWAYVYDATEGKLLWSGKVDRQDNVEVNSKLNAITVDGKPVHTRNVPEGHKYRIYFEPRDQ